MHLFNIDLGTRDEEEHAHANLAEHGDRIGEGCESRNVRPNNDAEDEEPDDVGYAFARERGQEGCNSRSGGDQEEGDNGPLGTARCRGGDEAVAHSPARGGQRYRQAHVRSFSNTGIGRAPTTAGAEGAYSGIVCMTKARDNKSRARAWMRGQPSTSRRPFL